MLKAYRLAGGKLERMDQDEDLSGALWIDLCQPGDAVTDRVRALGIDVPSLQDMEEIEISNRLYTEESGHYMTAVIPGHSGTDKATSGPVTFILSDKRLVTVRHHAARPFETFAARAHQAVPGCSSPARLLLGLIEEIVARQADLLENLGKSLDAVALQVFDADAAERPETLQILLKKVGRDGELLGRIRLGLLTLGRALSYFAQHRPPKDKELGLLIETERHDMHSLEVHADALSARIGLATDAILGLINLAQNATVRIVSVVAALFLPPTLIASIYGMNFRDMPELAHPWGYTGALIAMASSGLLTWAFFKWKKWL
jgi:magnesium transporter